MSPVSQWMDQRTAVRRLLREFLFQSLPGGPRWRHVWGTTLVFSFLVQLVTGFFLWTCYSPSSQTAWESVYYIQFEMTGGWLLRGLHHFMAQAVVVLTALHVLQMVIYGAYRAPRELNFWLLLALLPLVVGMSVTGWLLPFDQRGLWASRVPLNILTVVPVIGPPIQRLMLGGTEYSHHTLTRFFALHAGLLPVILGSVMALFFFQSRKHQYTTGSAAVGSPKTYWPDQALRDLVACLAVLATVLFFVLRPWLFKTGLPGAELGAPADPSETYSAARPEWFFLFLFQFLKFFPGGTEIIGAVIIPTVVMGVLFMMPFIGRWKLGHRFNVGFIFAIAVGAGFLTYLAFAQDHKDPNYAAAVEEAARNGARAVVLAEAPAGIPTTGAISLVRSDPYIQGPKLFAKYCATCHRYDGHDGTGKVPKEKQYAADLKGFASREWIAGMLDPEQVATPKYFGATKFKEGKMVKFVKKDLAKLSDADKASLKKVIASVSEEAQLKSQRSLDRRETKIINQGDDLLKGQFGCAECHRFHNNDEDATGPDLTGYGSRAWLIGIINNPGHIRFYGKRNDRMPAFGDEKILDAQQIAMIADWLRGDWYEPAPEAPAPQAAANKPIPAGAK